MFQQLIASSPSRSSRKPLTWVLSLITHGLVILLLIVVPLVHPETLGNLKALATPPPPLPAPPRGEVIQLVGGSKAQRSLARRPTTLVTPNFIPPKVNLDAIGSPDTVPVGPSGFGLPTGHSDGSSRFLVGFAAPSPRTVPIPEFATSTEKRDIPIRLRQGGEVQQANLVQQVKPIYPPSAITMRVQGAVMLEALIGREGRVENLRVLSGHPLLVRAACEAVLQWRYRPTLLNGEPVEVLTQVTVNFNLGAR